MRVARRLANVYAIGVSPKLFESLETLDSSSDAGKSLRDFGAAGNFLASKLFVNLFDLPFIPVFAAILYLVHPLVCLITLIGLAAMVGIGWLTMVLTQRLARSNRSSELDANAFAMSATARGSEIRALGMLPNLSALWGLKSARSIVAAEEAANLSADLGSLGRTVRQAIQVVTLAWGAWLVIHGNMSGGLIFMASMVSGKLLQPVEQAIAGWDGTVKSLQAFDAVEAVTKNHARLRERPPLPTPQGLLELRDVGVTLDGGRRLLEGLDFWVMPGECVVVEGALGSGKSTLLEIMAGGRVPDAGTLLLDSAPRSRWPAAQWGSAVGYFCETAGPIQGTVAMNIARFSPEVDQEEVYRVSNALGLHASIMALPQGYQTVLTEGTRLLSSGERRLLMLARAFYGRPKVLILDQPAIGLDQSLEGALTNLVSDSRRDGSAVVMVTRSNLLWRTADRAVRLGEGRLTEMTIPRPQRMPADLSSVRAAAQTASAPLAPVAPQAAGVAS